jgi:rod shape determining protein RodA
MKFNRRILFSFDWPWLLSLLTLSAIGLIAIWSTTSGTALSPYFGRQSIALCLAMGVFLAMLYFDYHVYSDFIVSIYISGLALLGLVLLFGRTVHNNRSWLSLGSFALQPSELVKVVVIVALAKYYAESDHENLEWRELLIGGLIVSVPMLLGVLQGDLGTAITFVPIYIALSFLGGVKRKYILVLLLAAALLAPVGWMLLKDYQKGRIQTVINPGSDPRRLGYHTIQSEIAIGSGKFLGKGLQHGSQSQLGFLPARHTDFIFAVLSEEMGFVGSMGLLFVLLFVGLRLLRASKEAKDKIGVYLVAGVLAIFLFHVMVNIGMVVGLLPIVGIPLPFVSAGGSSLVASFAGMSLCMNVKMRRYVN